MTPAIAAKVAKLETQLRSVTVDGQEYLLAEGDLLIERQALAAYAEAKLDPSPAALALGSGSKTTKLLVASADGKPLRWAPGVILTYCIQKETFTAAQYASVRSSIVTATEDWMATCGVEFRHLAALDGDPASRAGAAPVFNVRFLDTGGKFIAAAFFPDDPPARRRVLIDPSYFEPGLRFDTVGVLRHELGHVLGFRHEHIRSGAPAACLGEGLDDAIEATAYDPQSVMHYFCGGVGNPALAITELDQVGAQQFYGLPLATYSLARP
jgi:hypothetical protein